MKPFLLRIAFASLLAFSFTSAFAQRRQGNQGNQNRQQQRAGTLTQSVLDAMAAQSDPLQLIFRKDVQHDLQCDLGQRNKFDNLHDRQVAEVRALLQSPRGRTALADFQAKQRKETQDKMDELLTPGQKTRLKQIVMQMQGGTVLLTPEIQKQLGLTDEQTQRIKQVQYQRDTQVKQAQDSVANGEIRIQDLNLQLDRIQKETSTALKDVLSPEQLDAYEKLLGKPFKPGA